MHLGTSISILVLTLTLGGAVYTPVYATAEWKEVCRNAFRLQKSGDWMPAWQQYHKAITLLDADKEADRELINELQLNMATMQIQAGQYGTALDALQALKPKILTAKNKDSLQALRFWRRLVDASSGLKKTELAVEAQGKVIQIAETNFQPGSAFCLDEKRLLLELLVDDGKIKEAAKLAEELERVATTTSNAGTKQRFEGKIKVFFGKAHMQFWNFLGEGKIKEGLDVLHLLKKYYSPHEYMEWLEALRDKAIAVHSPQAPHLVAEAEQCAEKLLPDKKATEVYVESLQYHVDARTRRGKYDADLENILRKMVAAEEMILPPEKRNEDVTYIQAKSLLACTLAKLGQIEESEKMADTVNPAPAKFTEAKIFDAVYQARINGLAEAFLQRKSKEGMIRQFRKMSDQYKTMSRIPDKERLLTEWKGVEQQYLQRLQSP